MESENYYILLRTKVRKKGEFKVTTTLRRPIDLEKSPVEIALKYLAFNPGWVEINDMWLEITDPERNFTKLIEFDDERTVRPQPLIDNVKSKLESELTSKDPYIKLQTATAVAEILSFRIKPGATIKFSENMQLVFGVDEEYTVKKEQTRQKVVPIKMYNQSSLIYNTAFIQCEQCRSNYIVEGNPRPVLDFITIHNYLDADEVVEFPILSRYVPVEGSRLSKIDITLRNHHNTIISGSDFELMVLLHLRSQRNEKEAELK
jgi:hypothetical protein